MAAPAELPGSRFVGQPLLVLLVLVAVAVTCASAGPIGDDWSVESNAVDGGEYIVGGTRTRVGEIPWQASLQGFADAVGAYDGWFHLCGAAILSDRWLLTAAHCFPKKISYYRIVVGASSWVPIDRTAQTLAIERAIIHSRYKDKDVEYDIALIKLRDPINMRRPSVAAIELADSNTALNTSACVASGWGLLRHEGSRTRFMRRVTLPIVPNDVCRARYWNQVINDQMVCAGRLDEEGYGVCKGDSGGPLTCPPLGDSGAGDDSPAHVLVGLASFVVRCGSGVHPSVFTRVASYRSWISRNIERYQHS